MNKKIFLFAMLFVLSIFIFAGLVKASETVSTCLRDKNGSLCMEYPSSSCDSNCNGNCVPARATDVSECKLGVCYDSNSGICGDNSIKSSCQGAQVQWLGDNINNVGVCKKGCCILGNQASLMTSQQCKQNADSRGLIENFKSNIVDPQSCYLQSSSQESAACVFSSGSDKTCKILTRSTCISQRGKFYPGFLCSNPILNTTCEKQKKVGCVSGLDEVYWFDSCGNRENIYDADREKSWNGGMILSKNQSCELGTSIDRLLHKDTCGNCNKFEGSVCGLNKAGSIPGSICNDLNCVDENGNKRSNGESWCDSQGVGGTDKGASGFLRSTDTVGSEYFRKICVDGKVRTEPCADYRNEICIASTTTNNGKSVSGSKCIKNDWQKCLDYNNELKDKVKDERIVIEQKLKKECNENPLCFYKETSLLYKDGKNKVDAGLCLSKYAPGFDFNQDGSQSDASNTCGMASKTYFVGKNTSYTTTGGYQQTKKYKDVLEQVNDLCISLGDCGAKVNYVADLSENYIALNGKIAFSLNKTYIDIIKKYASDYISNSIVVNSSKKNKSLDEPKKVSFTCYPWDQISGGDKCNLCGKNGLKCSKYGCEALGNDCQLINEDTKDAACVKVANNDVTPPKIDKLDGILLEGYSYGESSDAGVKIKSDASDGCFSEFTPLRFGVSTDEPSQCRYDFTSTDFDSMASSFDQFSLLINHTKIIMVPGLDLLGVYGFNPSRTGEVNIYVRCQDKNENKNEADYIINLCVSPRDDIQPPNVNSRIPESEYVAFNAKNVSGGIYVSEPSDCRWDITDKSYDNMKNNLDCATGSDGTGNGWKCNTIFPLKNDSSIFYIRCKDQPGLIESNGSQQAKMVIIEEDEDGNNITRIVNVSRTRKRNEMDPGYPFTLRRVSSKLNIDSVSVDNKTFTSNSDPITLPIEVITSGGIDGSANCSYVNGNENRIFYQTGGKDHLQNLYFHEGSRNLSVTCVDSVGDLANVTVKFNIKIDTRAPIITRVYNSQGNLFVITNENAECRFSKSNEEACDFYFENATSMNGNELAHETEFDKSTYYIKCMDNYGNVPDKCNVIAKPGIKEDEGS